MPNPVTFLTIGLFFGSGLGMFLAAGTGVNPEKPLVHDLTAHDSGSDLDHSKLIEAGPSAPTLALTLHPDGAQSRNLQISVENFTFAPEAMNGPHVSGQGHAHVYVDNVKVARAYGPWIQLHALPKGMHFVRVTLNANDHSQLAENGSPIEAVTEVVID